MVKLDATLWRLHFIAVIAFLVLMYRLLAAD
jgi:hypothetical protein